MNFVILIVVLLVVNFGVYVVFCMFWLLLNSNMGLKFLKKLFIKGVLINVLIVIMIILGCLLIISVVVVEIVYFWFILILGMVIIIVWMFICVF